MGQVLGSVQVGVIPPGRSSNSRTMRQLLLLPTILAAFVFFLLPLGLVIVYSLGRVDLVTFDIRFGWTLDNYRGLADPLYLDTIERSILLSATATLGCLALGFPLAYFISRQTRAVQRVLLVLVIVPFWTSFVVRGYSIETLLQNGGPIDSLFGALGMHGHIDFLYTPRSIAVGIVYTYLPTMVLPIFVALERIDRSTLEAASDLGAGAASAFRRVTFPLAVPGVVVGCLIVGIPAMGEFVIPEILGGGKTLMLGNVITRQFLDVGNLTFGSAIAVTLMAGLSLALFARRFLKPLEAV
jgi:ABC-type spermidine/putrescine transport system permease subunit I